MYEFNFGFTSDYNSGSDARTALKNVWMWVSECISYLLGKSGHKGAIRAWWVRSQERVTC